MDFQVLSQFSDSLGRFLEISILFSELIHDTASVLFRRNRQNIEMVLGQCHNIFLTLNELLLQQTSETSALLLVQLYLQVQFVLGGHPKRLLYVFQFISKALIIGAFFPQLTLEARSDRLLVELGFGRFAGVNLLNLNLLRVKVVIQCVY